MEQDVGQEVDMVKKEKEGVPADEKAAEAKAAAEKAAAEKAAAVTAAEEVAGEEENKATAIHKSGVEEAKMGMGIASEQKLRMLQEAFRNCQHMLEQSRQAVAYHEKELAQKVS